MKLYLLISHMLAIALIWIYHHDCCHWSVPESQTILYLQHLTLLHYSAIKFDAPCMKRHAVRYIATFGEGGRGWNDGTLVYPHPSYLSDTMQRLLWLLVCLLESKLNLHRWHLVLVYNHTTTRAQTNNVGMAVQWQTQLAPFVCMMLLHRRVWTGLQSLPWYCSGISNSCS